MPQRTRHATNTSYWLAFFRRTVLSYFLSGKKWPTRRWELWPVAKISLINVLTLETNLSVDTPEFRESSGQRLRSISGAILRADSRRLQTTRGIVVIVSPRTAGRCSEKRTAHAVSVPALLRDKWNSLFNKETSGESSSVISDYCCCVISRSRELGGGEIFRSYYAQVDYRTLASPSS